MKTDLVTPPHAHPPTGSDRARDSAVPDRPGGTARWAVRDSVRLSMAAGIVSAALTLTVAEVVARLAMWASLTDTASSPFDSLGAAFIAITPAWLKTVAITLFGQHDKVALAVGMLIVFVLIGAALGLLGRIGRAAYAGTRVSRAAYAGTRVGDPGQGDGAESSGADRGVAPSAADRGADDGRESSTFGRGRDWATVGAALAVIATGAAIVTRPDAGVGDLVPLIVGAIVGIAVLRALFAAGTRRGDYDEVLGWGPPRAQGTPRSERRHALTLLGVGAIGAAVAAGLSRLVPGVVNIAADRAAVRLPPVAGDGSSGGAAPVASGAPSAAGAGAGSGGPGAAGARPASLVIPPTLPYGANPDIAGLTPFVTPDASFYRVDTAFALPRVPTAGWHLTIHGMVAKPLTLDWAAVTALPQIERWITLTCVSNEVGGNLVGNAAWQGVRLADLLAAVRPLPGADCLYSTSADDFTVTTPLAALTDGRDAMLAIGMNGAPLPIEHGFPARLVVPGLYGYVSATKWVVDLEVTTFAKATGYWTEQGWAPRGPIKMSSRIDTPGYDVSVGPGTVPIAGVAWAQHQGISAVQVQVDDGPWEPATLHGIASIDAWVQWVYRWDTSAVASGSHRVRCRAVDGSGTVQTGTEAPPAPNGSSGYHTITLVTA